MGASGTRLRAEYYDVGGARLFRGWFDTARQEACTFHAFDGPDGKHPCLPNDADTISTEGAIFADAACTARALSTGSASKYVVVLPPSSCDAHPAMHFRGGRADDTATYTRVDGTCRQNAGAPQSFYRLGAEIPLSSFAVAREVVEDRGGRVASRVWATDDGARQAVAGFDQQRNEEVTPDSFLVTSPRRWVPSQIAYYSESDKPLGPFTNATCCVEVATKLAYDARCPIREIVSFTKDFHTLIRAAGAAVAPDQVHFVDATGACVPDPGASRLLFVRVGDPIPDEAFAADAIVAVGAGRVKLHFEAADGVAVAPGPDYAPLFDSQRGAPCKLGPADGGKLRCLPAAVVSRLAYADAACSSAAAIVQVFPDFPSPREALVTSHVPNVPPRVRTVVAKFDAAYERDASGACVLTPRTPSFVLGDDVPLDAFALAVEGRE